MIYVILILWKSLRLSFWTSMESVFINVSCVFERKCTLWFYGWRFYVCSVYPVYQTFKLCNSNLLYPFYFFFCLIPENERIVLKLFLYVSRLVKIVLWIYFYFCFLKIYFRLFYLVSINLGIFINLGTWYIHGKIKPVIICHFFLSYS